MSKILQEYQQDKYAEKPREASQIGNELSELESAISLLEDISIKVAERLSPVLRISQEPPELNKVPIALKNLVLLAEKLRDLKLRVGNTIAAFESIVDRCEL